MKKAIIQFAICVVLGFGVGYLVFGVLMGESDQPTQATGETKDTTTQATHETSDAEEETTSQSTVPADNILNQKGCLGCHSVSSLNLQGGQVGPDLSQAYVNVEGKHGKPIEEFLKQPTSAVMSGVIGNNPLSDEDRKQVLEFLKKASEAK